MGYTGQYSNQESRLGVGLAGGLDTVALVCGEPGRRCWLGAGTFQKEDQDHKQGLSLTVTLPLITAHDCAPKPNVKATPDHDSDSNPTPTRNPARTIDPNPNPNQNHNHNQNQNHNPTPDPNPRHDPQMVVSTVQAPLPYPL